jgi:hypothetical protein
MSNRTVEIGRLKKALEIIHAGQRGEPSSEQLGLRQFRVKGHEQPWYFVDLDGDPICYCDDCRFSPRGLRMCKHEIVCRLVLNEPGVLAQAVEQLYMAGERQKEAAA